VPYVVNWKWHVDQNGQPTPPTPLRRRPWRTFLRWENVNLMRESQHCNGKYLANIIYIKVRQQLPQTATGKYRENGMAASKMQRMEFNIEACSKLITNRRILKYLPCKCNKPYGF